MLTCDEYISPASLAEAFAAMKANRGRYRIVAGATDTLPWAREGRAGDVHIPVLIDVARIPELCEISVCDKRARLGAATPIQRFLETAAAPPSHAALRVWFADDQVAGNRRRQHRERVSCCRRNALPDRARGRRRACFRARQTHDAAQGFCNRAEQDGAGGRRIADGH
jgi:hypothetical protein